MAEPESYYELYGYGYESPEASAGDWENDSESTVLVRTVYSLQITTPAS